MKHIKERKLKLPLIIVIVVSLAFAFIIYAGMGQEELYRSKVLKIAFIAPRNLEISERFASIKMQKDNDIILLNRNGTNFSNLNDYLTDLSEKNKFELKNQEKISYNNITAITGYIDKEKIYFFYVNNWVYSLSTSSKALYDDLDQIAQSFRYLGDDRE